ncbi:MAG TPA: hypothetical protein VKP65_11220 [Rhodothermales bacterium]|nr:hypothetical protein [Rhodothermales bacterium]
MKRQLTHIAFLALFAPLILSLPGTVQAQKQGLVSMHMEPVIIEAVPVKQLTTTLKTHTRLKVQAPKENTCIQFFYGIGKGRELDGPFASDLLLLASGKSVLTRTDRMKADEQAWPCKWKGRTGQGRGAIDSPWEAFDDPLVGFDDPLVGFDDPLVGFENPRMLIINWEEQYDSPEEALRGLWGDARRFVKEDHYGLVIYAVSVEGRKVRLQGAMLTPFLVIDSSGLGERQR